MRQPVNKFRYVITNRLGVLQVAPLGESNFTIDWTREDDGKLDYKNELPSKIIFNGEAFQNLYKLEKSIYRCDHVTITVERKCGHDNGHTWIPWFSGRMSFNDGIWDLDRCEVEIKLDDIKEDQGYENNKNKELNILQKILDRRTVYLTNTNIVVEKVTYESPIGNGFGACENYYWGGQGDPWSQGWNVYSYIYTEDKTNSSGPGDPGTCKMQTSWAREIIILPCSETPATSEWILVNDLCPSGAKTYARPINLFGCVYEFPNSADLYRETKYNCSIIGDGGNNLIIDNGVSLTDVVNLFINTFCPGFTFVSNFFQINPDIPSAINYVTGLRSKTRYITIFQKSDVKRNAASGNATKANLSFEKLFETLIKMYNVRWRVEPGNIFRMEHVSFFKKNNGFDLTQPKWAKFLIGKQKYSYSNETIPEREEFKFMEAGYGDFQGVPIIYSGCVSQSSRDSIKTHVVDKVTTDIELCLSNPDPDSKVVSDDGFVFVAADYDGANYYIITESMIFGGSTLNNSMAWAQLHRDYHKWDRPLSTGNMNSVETQFFNTKPTKKGEKITIPLCCGDVFNPDNTIKTAMGVGTVDKATFSFKDETLEVELLYPVDQGLATNIAPIANNDTATTYINIPILINVLNNDNDADGKINNVQIILAPQHGTAILQSNKQILYTPTDGYVGDDYIVYRIIDNWNEPSNNAMIAINVRSANVAPQAMDDSYVCQMNTSLIISQGIGLFVNDRDEISFTLYVFDSTSTNGGTVVVNADGSFNYTPATGFVGNDTFTYTIKDGSGLTDTATVYVEVRNPNNPVANNDGFYVTKRNQNLTIYAPGVLENDTTSVGALSVIAGTFSTIQNGSVSISTNGAFTYTPPANYTGSDNFNYTVTNGTGSDTGKVLLQILPEIYVRLQQVDTQYDTITQNCNNNQQDAGSVERGLFRLYFFKNSAGTEPLDVSDLNLLILIKVTRILYGGGQNDYNLEVYPSGTIYDIYSGGYYEYYHYEYDCLGNVIIYTNESITLALGNYTII